MMARLPLLLLLPCTTALPPHPRLLLTPDRAAAIHAAVSSNAQAASYFLSVSAQAAGVLSLPPVARPPDDGDVLFAARTALVRTYVLGAMWRLTSNATFAARGVEELLSFTTAWSNWQPIANALVMGELSHAAAIGLDWLHDYLSEAQRSAVVAGLVERGAAPFAAAYAGGEAENWWVCRSSNWASVTNSGAGFAALALLGEVGAPPYIPELLSNASANVRCSSAAPMEWGTGGGLAPDGAWWEGPMYSGYVLRYVVPFATALGAVTGDAGLLNLPGLLDAPLFQVASMDAAWRYFVRCVAAAFVVFAPPNTGACVFFANPQLTSPRALSRRRIGQTVWRRRKRWPCCWPRRSGAATRAPPLPSARALTPPPRPSST
jgi:hypothetical protein